MEIKVVIPSHGRAGRVETFKAVAGGILCVAKSQEPEYRAFYRDAEIVVHPDDVIGLAAKRDWICNHSGPVFMVDDDIPYAQRRYVANPGRAARLKPEDAYAIIQWCGNMAMRAGCFLFGFSKELRPLTFKPFQPIAMSGYVTGCAMGVLPGGEVKFASEMTCLSDFYVSLMNAHRNRKAFIDNRFSFVQMDTFQRTGGLAEFRTLDTEREDTLTLRRMFGDAVALKREKWGGGKRINFKNRNPYGRTTVIPF